MKKKKHKIKVKPPKTLADILGKKGVNKLMSEVMGQMKTHLLSQGPVIVGKPMSSLPLMLNADKHGKMKTIIPIPVEGFDFSLEPPFEPTEYPEPPLGFIDDV